MVPFEAFIADKRDRPFVWGKQDCCLFAADWVRLVTKVDPAQALRGKYRTELGAKRALKRAGFNAIEDIANDRLGQSLAPLQLTRGDIALVMNHVDEPTLGIVWGAIVWVMTPSGVSHLAVDQVIKGWRVSCRQS